MKKTFLTLLGLGFSFILFAQSTGTNTDSSIKALLREKHDAITWGAPATNGIQLGIAMFLKESDGSKKFGAFTYLYSTNFCYGLRYPPPGYGLELSLQDSDGKLVELTQAGKAITKPISIAMYSKIEGRSKGNFIPPHTPLDYGNSFNLLHCFKMEKAGTYTLVVGMKIYKLKSNGGIFLIMVPSTSIKVSITQKDLDRYKESNAEGRP